MRYSRAFVEANLARFAALLQQSLFAEDTALRSGWLQQMDPRIKTAGFLLLILTSSFSRSITVIVAIYIFGVVLALGSGLFSLRFVRRATLFMPLYTALIAAPSAFLIPGEPLVELIPGKVILTRQGVIAALFLILRVAASVSFMMMLVLTTSWPRLLKALRSLGVPKLIVFLLATTYRYIYVLLATANALFLARKSRRVGPESWQTDVQWLGSMLSALLSKSYSLSNDVFLAMRSRGFRGEPALFTNFRATPRDFAWLLAMALISLSGFYFGYWITP